VVKKRRHCGLDPQSPARNTLFAGDSCFRRNDEVGKWNDEAEFRQKKPQPKSPPEGDLGG